MDDLEKERVIRFTRWCKLAKGLRDEKRDRKTVDAV